MDIGGREMGEVKFRVWDDDEKIFAPIDCILGFLLKVKEQELQLCNEVEKHDFAIEQYIGIKDFNGREIYEGDKVKCIIDGDTTEHVVKYYSTQDYPAYDLEPPLSDEMNSFSHIYGAGEWIEVVGNIHEEI